MESIAYSRDTNANGGVTVTIKDPFIVASSPPAGTNLPITPMYLIDTQPVVAGARYLYLLARMDPNHEIKEVVISSLVEVTP
jgi:hypothetical protein